MNTRGAHVRRERPTPRVTGNDGSGSPILSVASSSREQKSSRRKGTGGGGAVFSGFPRSAHGGEVSEWGGGGEGREGGRERKRTEEGFVFRAVVPASSPAFGEGSGRERRRVPVAPPPLFSRAPCVPSRQPGHHHVLFRGDGIRFRSLLTGNTVVPLVRRRGWGRKRSRGGAGPAAADVRHGRRAPLSRRSSVLARADPFRGVGPASLGLPSEEAIDPTAKAAPRGSGACGNGGNRPFPSDGLKRGRG